VRHQGGKGWKGGGKEGTGPSVDQGSNSEGGGLSHNKERKIEKKKEGHRQGREKKQKSKSSKKKKKQRGEQ